jgi:hypothetical protein
MLRDVIFHENQKKKGILVFAHLVSCAGVGAGLHKMCRLGKSGQRACADKDVVVVVVNGSGACGEQSTTVLPVGINLKLL